MDFRIIRPDGSLRDVEAYAVPLIYDGKEAVLKFLVDIGERKRAQLEKEEIQQGFRRVAAQLMHLDEERRRIGRELHDSTGQVLAALELNLERLTRRLTAVGDENGELIRQCVQLASQARRNQNRFLFAPSALARRNGPDLSAPLVRGWLYETEQSRRLFGSAGSSRRFPSENPAGSFPGRPGRTDQYPPSLPEPHRPAIQLAFDSDRIFLGIEDRGRGIDPERLRLFQDGHSNLGVGSSGMRERIRQLGGEFIVESSHKGTRLRVHLPARNSTPALNERNQDLNRG